MIKKLSLKACCNISFLVRITVLSTSLFLASVASAIPIGGIEFPEGEISFADVVVSYMPGADVGSPYNDPNDALGIPDYDGANGSTSLGDGGELILQFTDNSLTASGDSTNDLWIFEIGGAVETFDVAISTDLLNWIELGSLSGQPTGIDIDSIMGVEFGTLYSYVRLTDLLSSNQTGFPFGEADIDAVGAISSGMAVSPVPIPAAAWLFGSALLGFVGFSRRKAKS